MTYGYHKHSVGVVTVDPSKRKRILQSYCNRWVRTGSIDVANASIIFFTHQL